MSKPEKADPFRRSVGHVLDVIGEGWSMLIVREAFLGTRRFEEFQKRLGIARNILTARLKKLCSNQILDRVPVKEGAKRHEYILTRKGKEMMPLLVALTQWGDRWVFGEGNEPVLFLDREHGDPLPLAGQPRGHGVHQRTLARPRRTGHPDPPRRLGPLKELPQQLVRFGPPVLDRRQRPRQRPPIPGSNPLRPIPHLRTHTPLSFLPRSDPLHQSRGWYPRSRGDLRSKSPSVQPRSGVPILSLAA